MACEGRCDASGNKLHEDIGIFLKNSITNYFQQRQVPVTVKYIDPSYSIRSRPDNASDSLICLQMGQSAMHAGMAGKTDMMMSAVT